jgi:hypothetical protein
MSPKTQATSPTLRRRRQDQFAREKTSLSLRADVLEAAKEIVQSGGADNLSAFVEAAVEEKVRRTRQEILYASYEAAAKDAAFLGSMSDVAHEFAIADTDGL